MENNPLGVALASACSLLLLVSAALAYVWAKPASSGAPAQAVSADSVSAAQRLASELGPISNYREVTDRPVFDQSRRPVLTVSGDGLNPDEGLVSTVADAPEVKLSGVVITPEFNLVTLTPLAGGKSFIAREGKQLEGAYIGWTVVDIEPRRIVLESLDGGEMELQLQVNTRKIEAPPKPEPVVPAAAGAEQGEKSSGTDEPLSRAEEIRQRIAERREELRRQAGSRSAGSKRDSSKETAYQSAIRSMINRRNKNDENEEKNNGGGSDD